MKTETPCKGSLTKKIMAFFALPLSFVIVAYLIIYAIAGPIIAPAADIISMLVGESEPDFSSNTVDVNNDNIDLVPIGADQEDVIPVSEITMPKVGEMYAHITIPNTGVDCDVYYGDDKKTLKKGPGQYENSKLPGFGSTTLVAAHVTRHFNGLQYVKEGDIIYYTTSYGAYEYKVTKIKIVKASLASNEYQLRADHDNLVLYTCYPFTSVAFRSERYMVFADMISGPKVDIYID